MGPHSHDRVSYEVSGFGPSVLEHPFKIDGEEEYACVLVRADEIAAATQRDRRSALIIYVERACVSVLGGKTPTELLADLVLNTGTETPDIV